MRQRILHRLRVERQGRAAGVRHGSTSLATAGKKAGSGLLVSFSDDEVRHTPR
jgi:hypothetical protein